MVSQSVLLNQTLPSSGRNIGISSIFYYHLNSYFWTENWACRMCRTGEKQSTLSPICHQRDTRQHHTSNGMEQSATKDTFKSCVYVRIVWIWKVNFLLISFMLLNSILLWRLNSYAAPHTIFINRIDYFLHYFLLLVHKASPNQKAKSKIPRINNLVLYIDEN